MTKMEVIENVRKMLKDNGVEEFIIVTPTHISLSVNETNSAMMNVKRAIEENYEIKYTDMPRKHIM